MVALSIALLVVALLANTFRHGKRTQATHASEPEAAVDASRVAEHLAQVIRFRTVSHEEPKEDEPAELDALRAYLDATYPKLHATLTRDTTLGHALVYTWKGSDPSLLPILLAAHQDVVPASSESAWTHPPFEGAIANGFVWGRGALDDKGPMVAILEAVESLVARGFTPKRTVVLAFGFDEEVSGLQGAKRIAESFEARGTRFDYVLDEGGVITQGIVPGVQAPVALIGLTEKGFVTVELSVERPPGHSSMPPAQTAVGIVARAIDRLEQYPMPARLTSMTRQMLETVAPELPFGQRIVASNLWLFGPLVVTMMAKQDATNAAVRTTTAPTVFHAGIKANVLPPSASALVNFRILPGDSVESVLAHVKQTVADGRVQVKPQGPFRGDPPPASPFDSRAYRQIEAAVRRSFPTAVVAPTLVLGATDARYYTRIAGGVYHFTPYVLGKDDLARIHGTDERFPVDGLAAAVRFYENILQDGPP